MKHENVIKGRRVKLLSGSEPTGRILDDKRFYGGRLPAGLAKIPDDRGPLILVEWDEDRGQEALANLEELEVIPFPDGLAVVLDMLPDDDATA